MNRLTLSFDNGPTPGITEGVLDTLAQRDLLTTFFVVGDDLLKPGNRALVSHAKDGGHWIGNHTMTHSIQLGTSDDRLLPDREIEAAQRELGDLAHPDKLFRPWGAGGILNRRLFSPRAVQHLVDGEYTCVLWNSVPRDWESPDSWVETALADIAELDWTVLVLHDIDSGAMRRLGEFLDLAIGEGVDIVQEFPDSCVPVRRGRLTGSMDHIVSS